MTGTVEDIGLRSTRIRTLARTIISIPNADLASQSIENFATRDKLLFNPVFSLRYETTVAQLRVVLAEFRALLDRHQRIESSSVRVRLLRFAPSGLEVEIFAAAADGRHRDERHGAGLPVAVTVFHAGPKGRPGAARQALTGRRLISPGPPRRNRSTISPGAMTGGGAGWARTAGGRDP
jgi:small-conductance mechanosensitive channel